MKLSLCCVIFLLNSQFSIQCKWAQQWSINWCKIWIKWDRYFFLLRKFLRYIKKTNYSDDVHCFYVLFCRPSFACTSSLSVVVCDFQREDVWPFAKKAHSGQPCFSSSQRNGSWMRSIYADVCAGVSADFLPNFHYRSSSHHAVANMPHCNIVVSKVKVQLCYYVYFQTNILGKGMDSLIPAIG